MELLIALAVIVAVAEIKEWKSSKRMAEVLDLAEKARREHQALVGELAGIHSAIKAHRGLIESNGVKADALRERLEDLHEVVQKAEINSATILKEYELNGVPLGYQRRNPDFIEGV